MARATGEPVRFRRTHAAMLLVAAVLFCVTVVTTATAAKGALNDDAYITL